MNKIELGKLIYKAAYLTGEFLLRSGKISNEYFDKYQFEANPVLLKEISIQMSDMIIANKYDGLAALEMGGIPIATAISLQTGLPIVFVRKKAKEYGTRRVAEGMEIADKKLLVIEDVVTSGGQIILSVQDLRNAGVIVEDALCVIDRLQGGKENLSNANISLSSLFTIDELKSY